MAKRVRRKQFKRKEHSQVEGRNPVIEALNAGRTFKRIMIYKNAPQEGKVLEIIKKARGRGIEIKFAARGGLDYISQTEGRHQGVIGILEPRKIIGLKTILDEAKDKRKNIFLMILTDVQDERNLGAIIRSAAAAGVNAVVVPPKKGRAVTPLVARASAGAVEHVPVIAESLFQAIKILGEYDVRLYAVELGGENIFKENLKGDTAFVIGGEDVGVSTKIQEKCDKTLEIPMPGRAQSLNMSVSAALVMYEKVRQELYK